MKTTLTLSTTTTDLADGVSFGFYRFTVGDQTPVDTGAATAEFDLAAGSYTGNCQAYAADGAPMGSAFSVDFLVPADSPVPPPAPRTWEAPSGLAVAFG